MLEGPESSDKQSTPTSQKPVHGIKITGVKKFAANNLPETSILKRLLLEEKDEMSKGEFIAKMDLWLKLLRMEFVRHVKHWQEDEKARACDMVSG